MSRELRRKPPAMRPSKPRWEGILPFDILSMAINIGLSLSDRRWKFYLKKC